MPEMSGLALAELIHKIHPGLPLLLATGYPERKRRHENYRGSTNLYTLPELARQVDLLAAGSKCK
jgi:DNA-binding NtrC family response regulator